MGGSAAVIAFARYLSRPYVLVLLAGALHPSPLRRQLDVPVLSLPLAADFTLLDAWLNTIVSTRTANVGVKIVVSSPQDAKVIRGLLGASTKRSLGNSPENRRRDLDVEVIVDPADWRGPAGLLHDIARQAQLSEDTVVVGAEAAVLPPPCLDSLLVRRADPALAGAIGACEQNRPAGVYAFSTEAIMSIPSIGFHDIKEQLLPSLYSSGRRVPVVRLMREVIRIRDLECYLTAVRSQASAHNGSLPSVSRSENAHISEAAHLSGACVVQDGVKIEDGALIHDSVLLRGAQIGGGAVVARSVVASGSLVHARSVVRSTVVAAMPRPVPRRRIDRARFSRAFPLGSLASEPKKR